LADVVQENALDEKEIEKQKTILLKELQASLVDLTITYACISLTAVFVLNLG